MLIGYARVSTDDQNLALQRDALEIAGCGQIFEDHGISGATRTRPGLDSALAALAAGDVLVVWKLDRLGRGPAGVPSHGGAGRVRESLDRRAYHGGHQGGQGARCSGRSAQVSDGGTGGPCPATAGRRRTRRSRRQVPQGLAVNPVSGLGRGLIGMEVRKIETPLCDSMLARQPDH